MQHLRLSTHTDLDLKGNNCSINYSHDNSNANNISNVKNEENSNNCIVAVLIILNIAGVIVSNVFMTIITITVHSSNTNVCKAAMTVAASCDNATA